MRRMFCGQAVVHQLQLATFAASREFSPDLRGL
jgi:hypothetical protein